MELNIIVFIISLIPQCSGIFCLSQTRQTSSIGKDCTEKEHCFLTFDAQTGDCPGSGNQCRPGWMGPGCQYVNLAYDPRDPVFDGNLNTSRKIGDGTASINFNGTFYVNALRMPTKNKYLGTLAVKDDRSSIIFNGNFPPSSPTIFFENTVLTSGLHMTFSSSLDIIEIEVFGGKNVALWKSTNQSSDYSKERTSSDKAVDGNDDGNFGSGTCTHTSTNPQDNNPTWNVNLGNAYYLIAIKIKNRNDIQNQNRINGFKLYGTAENGSKLLIYSDEQPTQNRDVIFLNSTHMLDVPINEITIEGPKTGERILTLCEVFVYASIKNKNGNFCPEKCQTNSICRTDNLVCPRCQDGWGGPYCYRVTCQRPNVTSPLKIATDPNKQTFDYNEDIEFRCPEGYNLNGTAVQHCTQNGILQQNLPTCLRITCQQPTVTSPLQIATFPYKPTFNYKESIQFRCKEGYNLIGAAVKQCTQNGILQQNLPTCSPITCQRPTVTSPLQIATFPYKPTFNYKESIQFRCKDGYNLIGEAVKQCTQNGILQQNLPTCSRTTCQRPTVTSPLQIDTAQNKDTFQYNESIEFRCKEGYNLIGEAIKQCTQNDILQQNLPTCSPITCQRPNVTPPLQIATYPIKQTFQYKDKIEFRCAEGYNLNGGAVKHCTQNGIFQQNLSTCSEITCQRPNISHPLQIDKRTLNDVYHYNHSITFICIPGYSLIGKSIKHCKHNEDFQYDLPICKEEVQTISDAAIAGLSVGSLALIVVVVVVIILLRKRNAKKPESKYYKNESLSLDDIDKQYAEVNTNRIRKNKEREPSKLEQASNEQTTTYYNMNSPDVDKAKQARQEVYYEFSPVCRPSKMAVSVSEFKNYVESKKGNQEFFSEQFKKFYTGLQFPATAAVAPGNKSKNKYKNIYPYDETRVLLKIEKGSSDSDFINASFIHGFGNVKSYVAAQGPLINTIDDFWWMVWNEKCDKIVMLTNLVEEDKVKCIQYWPDSDAMDTRNMKLELVVSESFADFTIRTFNLINGKESRTIRQFHFTAWPDKGVPAYASSLVHFHSKVLHTPGTLKGPMVVHCSAGIGRTGTFIALNYLVQQAKESGYVDVFECVETLRRQRLNMVQTLEQYKFLHNATLEALMYTSSDPSASKFPQIYEDLFKVDSETRKRNIDLNFENLNVALSTLPESAYSMAKISTNRKKNRYSNILPVDSEMPEIRDEENNPIYINAVFLPAYKSKRSFIATQMPLKDTAVDFWRLLYEQQVSTIVMLNQLGSDKPKENIGKYWPKDLNAVSEFGPFRITKKGLTEGKDFTIVDLCCHKEGQNEDERKLRLFQCHFWPDSSTVPTSVLAFLKLINDMELHHDRNNSGPLVVHCMNGAEKSGLFCVMQVVLERMKIEQDVAIHHVIQQMRSIRPSIIPNVEQFKFCHDVVLEFLKQFDDYSNFQ